MNKNNNAFAWLFQRVTAVFLILFLGIHAAIKFGGVTIQLNTWSLFFVDVCLLFFGLYHALNGIYSVAQDYRVGGKGRRIIFWALICIGCVMTIFGGISLFSFFSVAA